MQRRLLQLAIVLAACVPVLAGAAGVAVGARAFGSWPGAAADSQFRYLSGLLLAIGVIYWACVPTIERRSAVISALTAVVVAGGFARLAGMLVVGDPGNMRFALIMELAVAPAICLWQARLARRGS